MSVTTNGRIMEARITDAAGLTDAATVPLRPARDADADGLIELIAACWSEYPGTVMDVDGELPHLRAIATAFRSWGGRAWVAEAGGHVIGSVGVVPTEPPAAGATEQPAAGATGDGGGVELRMLYVRASARRSGLGGRLLGLAEAEARRREAGRIELWSDTRFTTAHRFYERRGYQRGPAARELHDLSASVEYYFSKPLQPH
jgi:GNAT superfamily N-acetyltransferase